MSDIQRVTLEKEEENKEVPAEDLDQDSSKPSQFFVLLVSVLLSLSRPMSLTLWPSEGPTPSR